MSTPLSARVNLRAVRKWARDGQPFAVLTCYDATSAKWLWRGGVKCLLVGDSAAEFVLGHDSTLPISVPFLLELTAAVRRGAPDAFVIADMPFGSYQCGENRAIRNAMRFMTHGGADVVKLEVDASFAPMVGRLARAGVPVVAHIGSRPQQVRLQGGYRAAGRSAAQADQIIATAGLMIEQGATMLLLEAVPNEVALAVVDLARNGASGVVPVIGCGGGPACDGHVVVLHDLLGLTTWQPPFAPPMADLGPRIEAAATAWAKRVESGDYLKTDHPYHLDR